jgi:2-oxoisovalerate dehydrogenase E1 component beta subunit
MPELRYLDAIREAMLDEMRRDERVLVLGEDVGVKGGVFGATDGFHAEFGEARVLDTPLAESLIVGAAIGMAVGGLRPIAEIQFSDFIYPAFNQIVSEAARIRYRSAGAFGCPIVIRAPYGGGVEVHGGLYHSQSIEAFFAHVPGLKVVTPYTPSDAKGLLVAAIRDPDPVLFLEHKRLYRAIREDVPEGDYTVPIGPAAVRRTGTALSAFAYGQMLHETLRAAGDVAGEGLDVEVVDLRTLRPLDTQTILASVRKTGKAMIVYEDNRFMGFGAEVAALVAEEAFDALDGPIVRVAGLDVPAVPYADTLAAAYIPTAGKIADAMRRLAAY